MTNTLTKIISGGQTGADTAALRSAKDNSFKTGGTAPPGFLTSVGKRPYLKTTYGLKEMKIIGSKKSNPYYYCQRSITNIKESDGTLAFRFKKSVGTDKTVGYCYTGKWVDKYDKNDETFYKPVLVVDSFNTKSKHKIIKFLDDHKIKTLNVCGHRDYIYMNQSFEKCVKDFMDIVLDIYDMRDMEMTSDDELESIDSERSDEESEDDIVKDITAGYE